MSEARDDPEGNTVYTRGAEKNTTFWNISGLAVLARQQLFEKVSSFTADPVQGVW